MKLSDEELELRRGLDVVRASLLSCVCAVLELHLMPVHKVMYLKTMKYLFFITMGFCFFGIILILARRGGRKTAIPFGPWMLLGAWGGIAAGGNGWVWAADEYGRHPGHPLYKDERMRDVEWIRHVMAEREWANKRLGKSRAQIDNFWRGDVDDALMDEYLQEEGLLPMTEENSTKF